MVDLNETVFSWRKKSMGKTAQYSIQCSNANNFHEKNIFQTYAIYENGQLNIFRFCCFRLFLWCMCGMRWSKKVPKSTNSAREMLAKNELAILIKYRRHHRSMRIVCVRAHPFRRHIAQPVQCVIRTQRKRYAANVCGQTSKRTKCAALGIKVCGARNGSETQTKPTNAPARARQCAQKREISKKNERAKERAQLYLPFDWARHIVVLLYNVIVIIKNVAK